MCERQCPACGSRSHLQGYGTAGAYIVCDRCNTTLAQRRGIDAAPIEMTYTEAEAWQAEGSGITEGAEADDPEDDALWGPKRWPLTGLAF